MQKITIVGKDSAAKSAVIVALSEEIDIIHLPVHKISTTFTTESKLVIYITNAQLNHHIIDRLHETYESMILVSPVSSFPLRDSDLLVSIAPFESFQTELILKKILSIRRFIHRLNPLFPTLTDIQLQVLEKYYKGFSKEKAAASLNMSARTYQNTLTDVRILFGVPTNREIIHLVSTSKLLAS